MVSATSAVIVTPLREVPLLIVTSTRYFYNK